MGRGAAGREREMADDVPNSTCRGGLDCRFGAGHGEERTRSMPPMFVTMEVSKLSGWLNARASCRESNGGHTRGAGRAATRAEAGGRRARWRCKQRAGEA